MTFSSLTKYLLTACLFFISTYSASALSNEQQNRYHNIETKFLIADNEIISPDQAGSIAKQGEDSKVLKISKTTQGDIDLYIVKLLTKNGHVKHIYIDAQSGHIVSGKN